MIRQVLSLFFSLRVTNLPTNENAALVIQEVFTFWQKTRAPIKRTDHCVDKLHKLYDEWKDSIRTAGNGGWGGGGNGEKDFFVENQEKGLMNFCVI